MHRCLLSSALPARARCVTPLPSLRQQRAPPAKRWLRYASTTADHPRDEESRAPALYSRRHELDNQLEALRQGQQPAWTPSASASAKGDSNAAAALDFILEGYETNAEAPARRMGRQREMRTPASTMATAKKQRMPVTQKLGISMDQAAIIPRIRTGSSYSERRQRVHSTRRRIMAHEIRVPRMAKLWAKPKWVAVNLGRDSGSWYSHDWNLNFARAQNLYDKLTEHSTLARVLAPPILWPHTLGWVEYAYNYLAGGAHPVAMPIDAREHDVWSQVALWLLYYDKDTLLEFLLATTDVAPRPPPERVLDCLQLLARYYEREASSEMSIQLSKLATLFHTLAAHPETEGINVTGGFLATLLSASDSEQAQWLYTAMKTSNFKINFQTWLHVADYFVKNGNFQQGLDAVLEAHRADAELESYGFRSVCTTLLRGSMKRPDGLRVCLRIVDNLVKIGLTLNEHIYNVIILNAVEAGDLRTAREVYHSMADNGLKPTEHTYAIMLKGCKQDVSDTETLHTVIREAIAGVDIGQHIVLATEMLHCLTLHHAEHNRDDAWSTICQAYAQLFDLWPLEHLGLPIPQSVHDTLAWKPTMLPNAYAIDIMVRAYLFISLQTRSVGQTKIYDIYTRFRKLVDSRTPPFDTVTESFTFNAFLVAFIKNKPTLVRAAEVIKDLQRPNSPCKPNDLSWNIFLSGFTRHGHLKLAEQVLNYMRSKDIPWTNSTWDHLISGYAGAQDAEKVVDTIRRAEDHGYEWNAWTYGGLRRLRESGKMEEILASRGYAGELDFSDEIKQGLGARIEEGYRPGEEEREDERGNAALGGDEVGVGSGDDESFLPRYRS